jgi:hypothetical protein
MKVLRKIIAVLGFFNKKVLESIKKMRLSAHGGVAPAGVSGEP